MRYLNFIVILLLSTVVRGQEVQPMSKDSAFVNAILQQHNVYRTELQLSGLTWSTDLAVDARAWATHLAEVNKGDHDTRIRGKEGENIWWGTSGAFTYTQMVGFWGDEKKSFVYGVFPDCKKGRSSVVGHYTQIIWKNTSSVGCALATNGKMDYLVCRYSLPGNVIGQKPY